MIDALPLLLGPEGYQISRSVRLRSSASAYFNRTFTTPTNAAKWTFNRWVKRGAIGARQSLFAAGTSGSSYANIEFKADDTIQFLSENSAVQFQLVTTQVFRDPSAWYNIHIIYDSANATSTDRIQLWINGVRVTAFSTATYPTTTPNNLFNTAIAHQIGVLGYGSVAYFDGYQTELNFIDGQALTPSSFGETNTVTGVWQPKKYAGTYGTNGFYLNFSDNSAATAAAIGKDNSGNGNNWTPNNISVTAGATYDSMLDVPTQWADGGNGRGNYCTFNPLVGTHSNTYSNGNLQVATSTANAAFSNQRATFGVSSGKWYWEITCQATSSAFYVIGITADTVNPDTQYIGQGNSYSYRSDTGQKATNGTFSTYGATFTTGDIIGVEFDADAGTLVFYKNNVSQGTAFTSISGTYFPAVSDLDNNTGRNSTFVANFGQRPFAYTPPSGFKALNTLNLPTPTILKGNQYFDATLWTGNGGSQTIANSGGMQPDFAWVKKRNGAENHELTDAVRGANLRLASNSTGAESAGGIAFNSTGLSLTGGYGTDNENGQTYVGWQWKEGATQGFDIVTYTGNGSSPRNISHSLGVAPVLIITKRRDTTSNWWVYSKALNDTGSAGWLYLNSTAARQVTANAVDDPYNKATPTSSVFTVSGDGINVNTGTYVSYLFAEVAGFSKFGSYTGNGSSDGVFVHLGFRARYLLIKETGNANSWEVYDTARNSANVQTQRLFPNDSLAEATTDPSLDILSNGFKCRAGNTGINRSGGTYIYAAFAENPFKNALAR